MKKDFKAIIIFFAVVFILFYFIKGLGAALAPLVIAFTLAYLLFPLIKKLENKGINRLYSIIIVSLFFFASFGLLFYFVIPMFYVDVIEFIKEIPRYIKVAARELDQLLNRFGIDLKESKIRDSIEKNSLSFVKGLFENPSGKISSVSTSIFDIVLGILNIFLIPLFFFYLVMDYERIMQGLHDSIPENMRPKADKYIELSNKVLSGFIRGQLLVAFALGIFYGVGLAIIGLKHGLVVGVIGGIFCVIPYVGATICLGIALLVGFATGASYQILIYVCLLFFAGQAVEGNFITPKIVGDRVGISAFLAVLALIVGGNLFGLIGMIIAIPVAAVMKAVLKELIQELKEIQS